MTRPQTLLGAATALMALEMSGCTSFEAWRHCGMNGCPPDEPLTAEITRRLATHPALAPPDQIYVRTADGVVFLSGQVTTDLQREVADSVARGVPGVRRVVDSIALPYEGR